MNNLTYKFEAVENEGSRDIQSLNAEVTVRTD